MENNTTDLLDLAQKTLSGEDTTTFKEIYGIGASAGEVDFAKKFSLTCNLLAIEELKANISYENVNSSFYKLAGIYSHFTDSDFALALSSFKDLANKEVEGMYDKLFFTMFNSALQNNPDVTDNKGHVVNNMIAVGLKKEDTSTATRINIK